ncbi:MAG: 16S rRNA (cytosine(1402)-N(4))-methyltransferase RsmH [Clostridia bacterium]|nr:16S rRNA (cytosine(1402)-N(4))-methyltransferase RsmH [Clostridia bacterium]
MSESFSHIPVLYEETIDSLHVVPDGVYVDCTAGGGGHSAGILERLGDGGRLICIDRDPDAVAALTARFGSDARVNIVHDNYSNIKRILEDNGIRGADGILADLGVSSHQLDTAERGFSFHNDAPLDMRMSREGPTAADLCNTLPKEELARIIRTYGEERYANSIAERIVKERAFTPIETTLQLAKIVSESMPAKARRNGHPARRTFQALRIEVNGELDSLAESAEGMFDCLKTGGILSIITFHSLEDRAIKQEFAKLCEGCTCPPEFPVCVCGKTPRGELQFKFKAASEDELDGNQRARSAKLRSIIKLKD